MPTADVVVEGLNAFIDDIGGKKATDIRKRIAAMRDKWDGLNDHIRLGMNAIWKNLEASDFERAEKIQKTLTVDWPSLCGTWMVGVRQLIQESKRAHQLKHQTSDAKCDEPTGYLIPVAQNK